MDKIVKEMEKIQEVQKNAKICIVDTANTKPQENTRPATRKHKPQENTENTTPQENTKNTSPQENPSSPYTPKIISIGPIHDGKRELQPMEDLKYKYLHKLLKKSQNDKLLERLFQEAKNMDAEVRGHYESFKIISWDRFESMLVKDGCFLLEFLSKKTNDDLGWLQRQQIDHDILLFENQIPFFVLQRFYHILRKNGIYIDADPLELEKVAYDYLNHMNMVTNNRTFLRDDTSICETDSVSNLLHLYHMMLFRKNHQPQHPTSTFFSWLFSFVLYILYLIHKMYPIFHNEADNSNMTHIMYPTKLTSATEIEEAGVRFQGSCMELRFEEGTLLIPALTLNQRSLRLLKNLMVFEFYFRSHRVSPYVNTYVSFLSLLVKNPEDLKVMEKHHIIMSGGGDESFELVGDLLQAGIFSITLEKLPPDWQSSLELIEDLEKKYCQDPRHRWSKLIKDYFGNPLSIIGVLAGVILLGLATLQTVFNVLSYYHRR